jgi:electron transport complex protein RnfE
LIIACTVTAIELAMSAFFHGLYLVLGIFIPLIVTNCSIIGRAEAFASKNNALRAVVDGLSMGLGFSLVLVVLGGMRELIGHGTLLSQAQLMFGDSARYLSMSVFENYQGFLLAILPPGAFLGLGFLIALKNFIDKRLEERALSHTVAVSIRDAKA